MSKFALLQAIWRETERRAKEWSAEHKGKRMNSCQWNELWEKVKADMAGSSLSFDSFANR